MTKQEIVDAIQTGADLPDRATAERALNAILESVTEELASGGSVLIRGFGSFQVRTLAARKGRDFKTNTSVPIPAQRTVKFEPGAELRNSVRSGRAEAYRRGLQARLDEVRTAMEQWGKRAEGLGAGAREYYRAHMDRLRSAYEEARYKLTLLQGSGGSAWGELRRGFDSAFKELRDAFRRAKKNF